MGTLQHDVKRPTGAGQKDVAGVIERLSDEYVRHINRGDADWLVDKFYAANAYFMPPGLEMARGRHQIRAVLQKLLAGGIADLAIRTETIDSTGDLAYRVGTWTLAKPEPDQGKFIEVYRRDADGNWKCVADTFNSNLH
jgi:ketosteroid isomerase-like protein